ncbi:MAG: hypothetical protein JO257_24345 [Deltaproteobacteria bacterium]|nr:hypothetical protein [Deltaproteobacteria bacterium]
MLQFLVTSKVRRRLLVLLWGHKTTGSVAELAELADASFASTHDEIKEMLRLQLVRTEHTGAKTVFSANPHHPDAEFLSRLAAADTPARSPTTTSDDDLKRKLVALGAPLRGVKPLKVAPADVLDVLVEGAQLSRRDAVVARTLPVCFWNERDQFTAKALMALKASPEDKHAVAFFLELAGELGGDRRLAGLAETLRDHRLTQLRPFFHAAPRASAQDFPLAAKWGFSMNVDPDAFRALFNKFVTP